MNIVLGGTSGLGKEIAEQFRVSGEPTLVLGSSYEAEMHGEGLKIDLADEANVESAVEQLKQELGDRAIKTFWWVSGYGYNGDFSEQENARRMAVVNFAGALPLVQFIWKKLLDQNEGTLAVVSSTTGMKARANEAVYAGTKHAQVGFTRSLGLEAERLKIAAKVALFLPGGMRTPFWDKKQPDVYNSFNDPKKVAEKMIEDVNSQGVRYFERVMERGELI